MAFIGMVTTGVVCFGAVLGIRLLIANEEPWTVYDIEINKQLEYRGEGLNSAL